MFTGMVPLDTLPVGFPVDYFGAQYTVARNSMVCNSRLGRLRLAFAHFEPRRLKNIIFLQMIERESGPKARFPAACFDETGSRGS